VSVEDAPTLAGGSRVAGSIPATVEEPGDIADWADAPEAAIGCDDTPGVAPGEEVGEDGRPAAEDPATGVTGETSVDLAVESRSGSAEMGDCGGRPWGNTLGGAGRGDGFAG
jgi:hypothetical protein